MMIGVNGWAPGEFEITKTDLTREKVTGLISPSKRFGIAASGTYSPFDRRYSFGYVLTFIPLGHRVEGFRDLGSALTFADLIDECPEWDRIKSPKDPVPPEVCEKVNQTKTTTRNWGIL